MQITFYASLVVAALSAQQVQAEYTADDYLELAQRFHDTPLLAQTGSEVEHHGENLVAQLDAEIDIDNEAETDLDSELDLDAELDSLSQSDSMSDSDSMSSDSMDDDTNFAQVSSKCHGKEDKGKGKKEDKPKDKKEDKEEKKNDKKKSSKSQKDSSYAELDVDLDEEFDDAMQAEIDADNSIELDFGDDVDFAQIGNHHMKHGQDESHAQNNAGSDSEDYDMLGPDYDFAQNDVQHDTVLAQLADYLSVMGSSDVDKLENYMAQVQTADETGDMLAQTVAIDDEMATIGDYLAQLNNEEYEQLTYNMAQKLTESTRETVLAQITSEQENEMLGQVASYMGQLSEEQLANMEQYLVQLETTGPDALAQTGLDESLASIADYLVQLDDHELSQLTTQLYQNAVQA